jgi:hypothetical protein
VEQLADPQHLVADRQQRPKHDRQLDQAEYGQAESGGGLQYICRPCV